MVAATIAWESVQHPVQLVPETEDQVAIIEVLVGAEELAFGFVELEHAVHHEPVVGEVGMTTVREDVEHVHVEMNNSPAL